MRIGVLGLGIMGRGIVLDLLYNDFIVKAFTRNDNVRAEVKSLDQLARVYSKTLRSNLTLLVANNFSLVEEVKELAECELIIETISEDVEKKKEVLGFISRINSKGIIATNTSSISINELAGVIDDPSRFLGLHFMNPPLLSKLVEIISSEFTSEATVEAVKDFILKLNKDNIEIKDIPGFVINRLLFLLVNQSYDLILNYKIDPHVIDKAMKKGANYPIGPIKLSENIGIDTCVKILENLFLRTKSNMFKPSELLLNLLHQSILGKKNNTSVYDAIVSFIKQND
jgi:3-hydroxybutyryl-CoA dehydrogenase